MSGATLRAITWTLPHYQNESDQRESKKHSLRLTNSIHNRVASQLSSSFKCSCRILCRTTWRTLIYENTAGCIPNGRIGTVSKKSARVLHSISSTVCKIVQLPNTRAKSLGRPRRLLQRTSSSSSMWPISIARRTKRVQFRSVCEWSSSLSSHDCKSFARVAKWPSVCFKPHRTNMTETS